jgi:nucleoid DNA-binding protein
MTKLTENQAIAKSPTKMELLSRIVNRSGVLRKQVGSVLEALEEEMRSCLKKDIPLSFMGLLKFYTAERRETAERKGTNPFTGEMTTFPAKPAHKVVRVRILKKLKEMVD